VKSWLNELFSKIEMAKLVSVVMTELLIQSQEINESNFSAEDDLTQTVEAFVTQIPLK
jgi:hypothetical protein